MEISPEKEQKDLEEPSNAIGTEENEEEGGSWFGSLTALRKVANDLIQKTEQVASGCRNDLLDFRDVVTNSSTSVAAAVNIQKANLVVASSTSAVSSAWTALSTIVNDVVHSDAHTDGEAGTLPDEGGTDSTGLLAGLQDAISGIIPAGLVEIVPDEAANRQKWHQRRNSHQHLDDRTRLLVEKVCQDGKLADDPSRDSKLLEEYGEYCSTFTFTMHTSEITTLLNNDLLVQSIHSAMVPNVVSEDEFWRRFFFRKHLLMQQEDEKRRLIRLAAADSTAHSAKEDWGDHVDDIHSEVDQTVTSLPDNVANVETIAAVEEQPDVQPSKENEGNVAVVEEIAEELKIKLSNNSEASYELVPDPPAPEAPIQAPINPLADAGGDDWADWE